MTRKRPEAKRATNVARPRNREVMAVTQSRFSDKSLIRKVTLRLPRREGGGPFRGACADLLIRRAHLYSGAALQRLHDLGNVLVGAEFVAGELQ